MTFFAFIFSPRRVCIPITSSLDSFNKRVKELGATVTLIEEPNDPILVDETVDSIEVVQE